MKIVVTQGGHSEFRVQHANREDLLVSSALTGVQAVEKVAEWLAVVPAVVVPAVPAAVAVEKAPEPEPTPADVPVTRTRSIAPKADK